MATSITMMLRSKACLTLQALNHSGVFNLCHQTGYVGCRAFTTTSANLRRKHYHPGFRRERREKMLKVELPDFNEERINDKLTPDQLRTKMKEKGIVPPRPWQERPIYISCTSEILEPYVPPEGDGKLSIISSSGAKQTVEYIGKKSKSYLAVRKIRSFDDDFETSEFAEKAQQIYIDALNALQTLDDDKLHDCVTERCYPEMMNQVLRKTIRWKFIKSLEPPRVTHIRCTDVLTKDNIFAQATVRMHTQQTLAVYDRFGRLMHGSEVVVKDVLEYVVFEKHLSNQYGMWRVHAKIIPSWMPPRDPVLKTFRKPDIPPAPPVSPSTSQSTSVTKVTDNEAKISSDSPQPVLA